MSIAMGKSILLYVLQKMKLSPWGNTYDQCM